MAVRRQINENQKNINLVITSIFALLHYLEVVFRPFMSRPTALIISVITNYVGVNFCSIFGIYGLNTKI